MICRVCSSDKDESLFETKSGKKTSRCLKCKNDYQKEYYNRPGNREKHYRRIKTYRDEHPQSRRALRYKISEDRVAEYLSGTCDLCESRPSTVIDHDHTTGKVRGGLCFICNTGLGKLGDSIEGLTKAIEYLKRTTE